MTALPQLDGFSTQDRSAYWLLVCDHCALTFYLPRLEERRARGWRLVLAEHVEAHGD
jgi:hypothetical protein